MFGKSVDFYTITMHQNYFKAAIVVCMRVQYCLDDGMKFMLNISEGYQQSTLVMIIHYGYIIVIEIIADFFKVLKNVQNCIK